MSGRFFRLGNKFKSNIYNEKIVILYVMRAFRRIAYDLMYT